MAWKVSREKMLQISRALNTVILTVKEGIVKLENSNMVLKDGVERSKEEHATDIACVEHRKIVSEVERASALNYEVAKFSASVKEELVVRVRLYVDGSRLT